MKFKFTERELLILIQSIYEGGINPASLPQNLYFAIADYLKDGLYKGFQSNMNTVKTRDKELLTELRANIYQFSGAKTYQEINLMSEFAAEAKGYKEFKDAALGIFDQYNGTWLRTEYDTAVGQGQCAVKWQQFEREKDVLPNLRYSAIGDACPICKPLDGMVLPVGHPHWRKVAPLNHFHCFCLLEATEDRVQSRDIKPVLEKMQDNFIMNPGIDQYVFSPKHPYFDVKPKDREYAKRNFNLPIPEHD